MEVARMNGEDEDEDEDEDERGLFDVEEAFGF